jgi:xanthine dehydrogenase accessory factor
MRADLLRRAAELTRTREAFAIATVVRREPASSAQIGNTALIDESGAFHGWLGGSCIRSIAVAEAVSAINDGAPRLISISPHPEAERRPGVKTLPMTCHSGGTVDIFIEPVLPAPRLLVFGVSAAAQALARLAHAMGYAVDAIDPEADRVTFADAEHVVSEFTASDYTDQAASTKRRVFAVVATLGQHDAEATMNALAIDAAYVGVVASRTRFAEIAKTLAARGVSAQALARVTNPAGLDIGARSPEEIALSILAEIVRVRHAAAEDEDARVKGSDDARLKGSRYDEGAGNSDAAERDPVCGMTVSPATARHHVEHGGRTFYFCCGGCREKFLAAPDRYVPVLAS